MKLVALDHNPARRQSLEHLNVDYLLEQEVEKGGEASPEKINQEAAQYLHEYIDDPEHHFFLFSRGKNFVGCAEVLTCEVLLPGEDVPEPALRLVSFYIVPTERRKKIGSHFMGLLRAWGGEKQAALIEIEVPSYLLGANRFLEAQGFEIVSAGVHNLFRIYI